MLKQDPKIYSPLPEYGDWNKEFLLEAYRYFKMTTGCEVDVEGFINGYAFAGKVYEMIEFERLAEEEGDLKA